MFLARSLKAVSLSRLAGSGSTSLTVTRVIVRHEEEKDGTTETLGFVEFEFGDGEVVGVVMGSSGTWPYLWVRMPI